MSSAFDVYVGQGKVIEWQEKDPTDPETILQEK